MMAGIPSLAGGATARRLGVCASFVQFPEMRVRCEMKGRLAAIVGVFCIAMLVVPGTNAKKPDKPGGPEIRTEYIAFSGDFLGGEEVLDCCGNSGPARDDRANRITVHGNMDQGLFFLICPKLGLQFCK